MILTILLLSLPDEVREGIMIHVWSSQPTTELQPDTLDFLLRPDIMTIQSEARNLQSSRLFFFL